jgi:hypothetical protein
MSPRDVREVRIVFDVSDDLRVASDPQEGGEVVHSGEPAGRGTRPEEIPLDDRSPDPRPPSPTPAVGIYCRGPFEFTRGSGNVPFDLGPHITFRRNETEAGARGEKLAPGTCAFAGRPVSPDEPTSVYVTSANTWYTFAESPPGREFDAGWLAGKFRTFARHQLFLSWFSNLITRSDYVIILGVRREEWRFVADEQLLDTARYIPFTG